MSRQSMPLARLIGWFRDVKTLPKLLLGFGGIGALMLVIGVIGWTGMQSLRTTLTGSTVMLAKVETLISNAGLYHSAVARVAGIQRKEDFEAEIRPLADLREKMSESLQEALATPESDGTASLQQVPEDVRTIQAVLAPYRASAEAAVGILKDSFSETLTEEQRS